MIQAAAEALAGLRWQQVGPAELPPLAPPAVPLGPLRRALKKATRPVFLVNDTARVQLDTLPAVLADLWQEAGEPPILVATGTHAADPAALRDRLGGLPVEVHDAKDAQAHVALDEGAPWRVDRRVGRADLLVAFGSVEPHYFAGWAGAHKTATVGVWDRATTERNHQGALEAAARPTALEGNPIYDDIAACLAKLEEDRRLLTVNHVLDGGGRPLGLGLGTWRGSLRRCAAVAARRFVRAVPRSVDVLVAKVEGPLSRSLYQADKGVKNTEHAVKDGGDLVLVANLEEGLGADRFIRLLEQAPDLAAARAQVERDGYVLGDHKAVRWRALEARGVRIRVVSPHLDPAAVEAARIEVHATLEDAFAAVRADGRGGEGEGLVVEDAGVVVATAE